MVTMANPTLSEILGWSQDQPGWQRDALRRLFVAGTLTTDDVAELLGVCKATHGLSDPGRPHVLAAEHLAITESGRAPVSLVSVTHHRGVNALALEQTVSFGPGLTVVYGPNAAGKSGYARILKQACRSRAREDILGDVLAGEVPVKAQVTIRFREGTDDPLQWISDDPPSNALAAVSVFDTHCAPVYLRDKTDVAFRPFGLDVFDRLSTACAEIRKSLEAEQATLQAAAPLFSDFPVGTRVQQVMDTLTSLTRIDDVRALATLSIDEGRRLHELRDRKRDLEAADPKRRAQELTLKARRVDVLAGHATSLLGTLATARLDAIRRATDTLRIAREALALLRRTALTTDLLAGTGEERWRAMWDAAKTFSEVASPRTPFPALGDSARCPFCQQPIGTEAATRLAHLAEYVSSAAQEHVRKAEAAHAEAVHAVRDITVERDEIAVALAELEADDPPLGQRLARFLAEARRLRDTALAALRDGTALPIEGLAPAIDTDLKAAAEVLRNRASQLAEQSRTLDPTVRQELAELEARSLLEGCLQAVEAEIERQKRLAAYKQCLADTTTQAITRKSTELTKSLVTDQLRSVFQTELAALHFTHLAVELQPAGGARGALFHRVVFTNAPGVAVTKVLSEGESRTLSLASFLTELTTASAASGIIFDDPVSSLDHIWRGRIAARLVTKARNRQVIVFTHDILFLRLLLDEALRQDVPCLHQYVRRESQAGLCSTELPWLAMSTKDRIGALKNHCQAAEKVFRTAGADAYERDAREVYGLLREAWEHAIGEILLNDVIERYRHSIESQKVRHLHDITEDDCRTVNDAMTECSRWIRGHDHPPADAAPFPAPTELRSRIAQFEKWVQEIKRRRG